MTPDAIDLYSRLSRTIREMYEQMDIYQRELGKDLGSKKRIVYAN